MQIVYVLYDENAKRWHSAYTCYQTAYNRAISEMFADPTNVHLTIVDREYDFLGRHLYFQDSLNWHRISDLYPSKNELFSECPWVRPDFDGDTERVAKIRVNRQVEEFDPNLLKRVYKEYVFRKCPVCKCRTGNTEPHGCSTVIKRHCFDY